MEKALLLLKKRAKLTMVAETVSLLRPSLANIVKGFTQNWKKKKLKQI